MASLEDLKDALINADRAGDTASATVLADEIYKLESQVGAIDTSRPLLPNNDGSFSTERTITVDFNTPQGKRFYNIPTIINGQQVSEDEAVKQFQAGANKPVGEFNSMEEALSAAQRRSNEIGNRRLNQPLHSGLGMEPSGSPYPQPSFLEASADYATEKLPTEATEAFTKAYDYLKDTWEGQSEDYPEMPRIAGVDTYKADTPKGQLHMLKKRFPNAERDVDNYGNMLFIPNEEMAGFPAGQEFYINKPGASGMDLYETANAAKGVIPEIGVSIGLGGAGFLKAGTKMFLAGLGGETIRQNEKKAIANEPYSFQDILKAGMFSAGSEVGGRALSGSIHALGSVLRRVKASPNAKLSQLIDPQTGKLTTKTMKAIDERGITPFELRQMYLRELNKGSNKHLDELTPDEFIRQMEAESIDVAPTMATVTKHSQQMSRESHLKNRRQNPEIGEPLREREAINNAIVANKADEFKSATGGTTDKSSTSITNLVQEMDEGADELVHLMYEDVKRQVGNAKKIKLNGTFKTLANYRHEMRKAGMLDELGVWVDTAKDFGVKVDKDGILHGSITVNEAEVLRRKANELMKGKSQSVISAMMKVKNGIDEDVISHAGKDAFGTSRALAAKRFSVLHSDEPAKKVVRDIVEGTTPPEKAFEKTVLSNDARTLPALRKAIFFGSETSERSKLVWNNIRRESIDYAMKKATAKGAPNMIGQSSFNGAAFREALEDGIGHSNLELLFNKNELAHLYKISRVATDLTDITPKVMAQGAESEAFDLVDRVLLRVPGALSKLTVFGRHSASGAAKQTTEKAFVSQALEVPSKAIATAKKEATKTAATAARRSRQILPKLGVFSGNVYNGYSGQKTDKEKR